MGILCHMPKGYLKLFYNNYF
uniref:Uncharacterized protein n=1 Tax=Rhizophora mucronata TaxID=61149 RepID=A0A2P2QGJ3_RHIMU